ncbi:MAG: glycoside hydrolase family 97 protein [Cyclobacteriaceae bacterium]|uniref:Glycoside hydrolase family 97 protein n=1 Tax=candidate division WWE3 bacterium TaxID=2053526 RepID=A0A955E027_UNCKA|nr:glycoside hydrolase family 97 protein [candidate division WWE3 bacterium]MCB0497308.1 glycoside hydrolase family 97 protein [Cyclobacteriaceae bacterium]
MKTRQILLLIVVSVVLLSSCTTKKNSKQISSPNGSIVLTTFLSDDGKPGYEVTFDDGVVIDSSFLGYLLNDSINLTHQLKLDSVSNSTFNETWERSWGESRKVNNHYNQLTLNLSTQTSPFYNFKIVFRVFDDGIGFRYEIPKQAGLDSININKEETQFHLVGDLTAWWIPGDWESYEHLWTKSRLSEIDAGAKRNHPNLSCTLIPDSLAVNTPLTMEGNGYYLSIHEAELVNYADMTLHVDGQTHTLTSALVPWPDGIKVKTKTPMQSPWRTIEIVKEPGELIASNLIVNLNEPSKIENTDWIKPSKYMGIWWEMHIGKSSWAPTWNNPGATTENAKKYIDFASKHHIDGLLVEGWNTGWENWLDTATQIFDFVTPYPYFDIDEVIRYGKERGVNLIGHHETSGDVATYDRLMDSAYQYYEDKGVKYVKSGYVGDITPKQYHHSQWMVNHYLRAVTKAADHHIMLDVHEPIKATGLRRTWPNLLSREGLRGQEFNAWSETNPPSHTATIPFTRMLGGPVDFTPGIFNIKFNEYKKDKQVNTTLAKQLALYVVIYSPVQMAADLPEHYEKHLDAFKFIEDVPVNWEQTKVLNGAVGEYVTIARQERGTDNWFIGSITNEEGRDFDVPLNFLQEGNYKAVIYSDGPDAHWDKNPVSYTIDSLNVTNKDSLHLKLAQGGGAAIALFHQ